MDVNDWQPILPLLDQSLGSLVCGRIDDDNFFRRTSLRENPVERAVEFIGQLKSGDDKAVNDRFQTAKRKNQNERRLIKAGEVPVVYRRWLGIAFP